MGSSSTGAVATADMASLSTAASSSFRADCCCRCCEVARLLLGRVDLAAVAGAAGVGAGAAAGRVVGLPQLYSSWKGLGQCSVA